jgi:hypothetical protein
MNTASPVTVLDLHSPDQRRSEASTVQGRIRGILRVGVPRARYHFKTTKETAEVPNPQARAHKPRDSTPSPSAEKRPLQAVACLFPARTECRLNTRRVTHISRPTGERAKTSCSVRRSEDVKRTLRKGPLATRSWKCVTI